MPCYSRPRRNQTQAQRRAEVKKAVTDIDKLVAKRKVGIKVGPQGAVTFTGLDEQLRAGMTDVCIYQMLMNRGSEGTMQRVIEAEQRAGRKISQKAVQKGVHSHDGGASWHPRG